MPQMNILAKIGDTLLIVKDNSGDFHLIVDNIDIGENYSLEGLSDMVLGQLRPMDTHLRIEDVKTLPQMNICRAIIACLVHPEVLGMYDAPDNGCPKCGAKMIRGSWSAPYSMGGGGGETQNCSNPKCKYGYCTSDW